MNKLLLALKSRAFWTVVVMVVFNTVPQLKGLVNQSVLDGINTVLGLLITYFHLNPSQSYNQ